MDPPKINTAQFSFSGQLSKPLKAQAAQHDDILETVQSERVDVQFSKKPNISEEERRRLSSVDLNEFGNEGEVNLI